MQKGEKKADPKIIYRKFVLSIYLQIILTQNSQLVIFFKYLKSSQSQKKVSYERILLYYI